MDLERVKRVGTAAAYNAGKRLAAKFGRISDIRKKEADELVTEADVAAEAAIIDTILTVFPDHSILSEEKGSIHGQSDGLWIIDPLDGTVNYAHQISAFAVSIAFVAKGTTYLGIVLNPISGELFIATRDGGASLNGHPIRVNDATAVSDNLVATGFPYDLSPCIDRITTRFYSCLSTARGLRRIGSAALDLCYVACGRFGAFWEENLKPWDTAAGELIVREAGGRVSNFSDETYIRDHKEILATNGHIHTEMIELLKLGETG